ncbi:MAG: hypothetical protein R2683_02845 [Bifidobacterium adolescentis]
MRRWRSSRPLIDSQQLADAIAAKRMTRLPIRFPSLALNASALQAELKEARGRSGKSWTPAQLAGQASRIADKTEEIRKQAAGALDEAHSVIDMLCHPEQAKAGNWRRPMKRR